jgi:glycosyltransferase involved in cell wall biosynthesis
MRILLVSHARSDPDAGASRVYHLLDEGLRARGHQVTTLHYDDLAIPRAAERVISRLFLPQAVSRRAAREPLDTLDVIMTSSGMLYPLYEKLRRQPSRPLLINHLHGTAFMDNQAILSEAARGHLPVSWIYRNITGPLPVHADGRGSRAADLTITQNKRDQDFCSDQHFSPAVTIPLPVHPEILAATASAPPPGARDPLALLWFGSWSERKGAFYLPRALALIAERHPNVRLTLGGIGGNEPAVRSRFPTALQSNLTFLPRITRAEHIAALASHSIFLFPSLSEGFGFALLEALSMGLAAVTTATGLGADLLQDCVNALIIPPASSLHIAQATLRLIDDPTLRAKLSHNARELAAAFTIDRMVSAYEAAFASNLHRRSQAAK